MKVQDLMTTKVVTVSPEISVKKAFWLMKKNGFRHLPVCKDGTLVGIVTDRDLRRPEIADMFKEWEKFYRIDEDIQVASL